MQDVVRRFSHFVFHFFCMAQVVLLLLSIHVAVVAVVVVGVVVRGCGSLKFQVGIQVTIEMSGG